MAIIGKGAKRKVSARNSIFGGSCGQKPLPLEDRNITGVPQAAQKIKRAKLGSIKKPKVERLPKLGYLVQKLEKCHQKWVEIDQIEPD